MSNLGKLFMVTGMPGVGVEEAIAQYCKNLAKIGEGTEPHVVMLEDMMWENLPSHMSETVTAILDRECISKWDILVLPRDMQRDLWAQACLEAMEEIGHVLSRGDDVILSLHACWYHNITQALATIVDRDLLKAELEQRDIWLDKIVLLIDDIYDVAARLTGEDELIRLRKAPSLSEWLEWILLLLRWRDVEMTLTESIGEHLGADVFVLAVKHEVSVFEEILAGNKPCLYLSHPITTLRKLWQRGTVDAHREADELRTEIDSLASRLREDFAVLEPTTIDELCFHGAQLDVTQRWPLSGSEPRLWDPPDEDMRDYWWRIPESPSEDETETIMQALEKLPEGDLAEVRSDAVDNEQMQAVEDTVRSALSGAAGSTAMEAVQKEIRRQISVRDYALVEQSTYLAVYRPRPNGKESEGVNKEVRYYDSLQKLDQRDAPAYVLNPAPDHEDWLRQVCAIGALRAARAGGLLAYFGDDNDTEQQWQELETRAIQELETTGWGDLPAVEVGRSLSDFAAQFNFQVVPSENPLGGPRRRREEERLKELGDRFLRIAYGYIEELSDTGVIALAPNDLGPTRFGAWVSNQAIE